MTIARRPLLNLWMRLVLASIALSLPFCCFAAPVPIDEDAPWPRVRSTNGNTVTLHLPQVERWTSNSFVARAAVEVRMAKAKSELLGVVWFEAHGTVDQSNRLVTLDRLEITKGRFPTATDNGSNALAIVREVLPAGARTVSLDYLVTALGFVQAAARQGASGLKHEPPQIIWATNRTALIRIDGEPVLRPIEGKAALERVINTPALLVRDKASARFYLSGAGQWFAAASIQGPWGPAENPPAAIASLAPPSTNQPSVNKDLPPPRIIISTTPAELLMTSGMPDWRSVSGAGLQYVIDSDNLIFFHNTNREVYVLLSGRWFKANSFRGPWTYVAPHDLPTNFSRIPPNTPQAMALSSVPGTPQAELAVLANSVPTTATVNRHEATIQLTFDGEPKFKPIEGTQMSYAINAQLPVIRTDKGYFALDNGVWFTATSPSGPWQVATEVPDEIYSIPPTSPVYYATYARVYQASDDEVEVGYTAGYLGAFEDEGTVVYGTGWDYEPYYGDDYYGWGWTWGYGYVYVPWYQWWLWRQWWNEPGGLRAAAVENVYDRWQGRKGLAYHDQPARGSARAPAATSYSGYPALYGRFTGRASAGEWAPPASTLALNPYTRPQVPVRAGEVPRGAQLLTTVQQAPGGGRDIYASPDGNVYLRRNDAWYRREGNNWNFYAPTKGSIDRNRAATAATAAGGGQRQAGNNVYQPAANRGGTQGNRQTRADRVPQDGYEARAHEVAALEREYYARSLAQMRSQNTRNARPARSGRRGR